MLESGREFLIWRRQVKKFKTEDICRAFAALLALLQIKGVLNESDMENLKKFAEEDLLSE